MLASRPAFFAYARMVERRLTGMIAAAAVLIVVFISGRVSTHAPPRHYRSRCQRAAQNRRAAAGARIPASTADAADQ